MLRCKKNLPTTALFALFMFALGLMTTHLGLREYENAALQLVADVAVCSALLLVLPRRLFIVVHAVLIAMAYLLSLVDAYCVQVTGSTITPAIVRSLTTTNAQEVGDFFTTFNVGEVIKGRMFIILLLLVVHLVALKYAKRLFRLKPRIPSAASKTAGAALGLLTLYAVFVAVPIKIQYLRIFQFGDVSDIEGAIFRREDAGAYQPVFRLALALRTQQIVSRENEHLLRNMEHVEVAGCTFRSPIIVLIIGESYNRHHSQLYGYTLPTTPLQAARAKRGELFVFDDVVSPWNITSNAFNLMFSLYHYGAEQSWSDYPLFPQLFRLAGYQVAFLSNQYVGRLMGNQTGGFFLLDKRIWRQLFDIRNKKKRIYDEHFLSQASLIADAPYQLNIFHLQGQHYSYKQRYPEQWSLFSAKDYGHRHLDPKQKEIVAQYDNATRYNDYIVDQILQRYEDREAIVVYLADHGEECYDDLPVHGRLHVEPFWKQVHQEFEVPFWIWCSPDYRQQHPDVVREIQASQHRPYMTDLLPHFLLYLAGIDSRYYRETLNLISPDYDSQRQRMIEGIVDYDALRNAQ